MEYTSTKNQHPNQNLSNPHRTKTESVGTAAAGRVEVLIGKLPARRRGGADEEPETERPEPEDPPSDDYDYCGRAIEPDPVLVEQVASHTGASSPSPGTNLEAMVGQEMTKMLDGIEAGMNRVEGPAKMVEEKVEQCVVGPVTKTLDGANAARRMEGLADSIGKTLQPVGAVVNQIERAVVRFVDDKVSPQLGSVMGPASAPPRRNTHSHEH